VTTFLKIQAHDSVHTTQFVMGKMKTAWKIASR